MVRLPARGDVMVSANLELDLSADYSSKLLPTL